MRFAAAKEVFIKQQRKSVLTERVPENILTPLLSLSFDFSPCYNGSACRVWKNIRVTRAEGISDGDEGWIRDRLQYISYGSFGSGLEKEGEKKSQSSKRKKKTIKTNKPASVADFKGL